MSQMHEPNSTFGQLPDGAVDFPAEERKVQQLWDEERVFEKALEKSKQLGKPEFVCLNGPPFATGDPHYRHLMAGTLKDGVCRFQHQTGWHGPRRFGWDFHGLPLEQLPSKNLNLNCRHAVLHFGVTKYCDCCESLVHVTTDAWEKPSRKLGRWCDLENMCKTLDRTFMESVWWMFSELLKKGLFHRAFQVMPYSTGCQTVLSNSEVRQHCYKDVVDQSLLVKFELYEKGAKKIRHLVGRDTELESGFMLAWTTTHWALPANQAIAVNHEAKYCLLRVMFSKGTVVNYVCGVARAEWGMQTCSKSEVRHFEVVGSDFLGKVLYKLKYHPLYKLPDHVLLKRYKIEVPSPVHANARLGEKTEPAGEPDTAVERLMWLQGQVLHGESPLRDEIFNLAYGRFSDDRVLNQEFRFEWDEIQQYWGDDLIHPHRPETWIQDNGFTLMHAVIELGAVEVLEWLLTHGAKEREWIAAASKYDPPAPAGFANRRRWGKGTDMASDLGVSPLKRAVEMDQPECVKVLLKHGARKDYRPRGGGCTAGESARSNKRLEIARMLEQHQDERIVTSPFRGPSMAGPEYVKVPLP